MLDQMMESYEKVQKSQNIAWVKVKILVEEGFGR